MNENIGPVFLKIQTPPVAYLRLGTQGSCMDENTMVQREALRAEHFTQRWSHLACFL